jgi:excisionase family DNA binding protein
MNAASAREPEFIAPVSGDATQLAEVSSFLEAHLARRGASPAPAFYLSGADEHDRVELSAPLFGLLKDVVDKLSRGQSVSIVSRDREISTQQAAEILGISRPTVVSLIEKGELAATVPAGVRRKLRLAEVLAYREGLYERRNTFIAESSAEFDEVDEADTASLLREARRAR